MAKRWASNEDKILIDAVKKHHTNRQMAFREASKLLGRSVRACAIRWYDTLSNPKSKGYIGVVFMSISSRSMMTNRSSNVRTNISERKMLHTLWIKLKSLLKL